MLNHQDRRMLADIEGHLHEYTSNELEAWRRHVVEHPYRSSEISELVTKMLTKEINNRNKQ
jgi:hypothetical protein